MCQYDSQDEECDELKALAPTTTTDDRVSHHLTMTDGDSVDHCLVQSYCCPIMPTKSQ